jgi:hypothetical protein
MSNALTEVPHWELCYEINRQYLGCLVAGADTVDMVRHLGRGCS